MFPNGLASQEGTIQKGNEVLSINGKSLKGATHNDALAILRQARDPRQAVIVTRKPALEAAPDLNSSTDSTASASVASDVSVDPSKCPELGGSPVGHVALGHVGPVLLGLLHDARLARDTAGGCVCAHRRAGPGGAADPAGTRPRRLWAGAEGTPHLALCFPCSRGHGTHGDTGEDLCGPGLQPGRWEGLLARGQASHH